MTELFTSPEFLWSWMGLGLAVLVALFVVSAPYGRHTRSGWGPLVPARMSWVLMELPALVVPLACLLYAERWGDPVAVVFIGLWVFHYGYRSLIYPFLGRVPSRPVPISITLLGATFNVVNGLVQGAFLFLAAPEHTTGWFTDGRFGLGLALFLLGFMTHFRSDAILRKLRRRTEVGYRIPDGFLYRWVSSPNYLGEIVQWLGWALLTWSMAGLSFAVWTVANLLPRAVANHRWYHEKFEDYPEKRKALVPFIF